MPGPDYWLTKKVLLLVTSIALTLGATEVFLRLSPWPLGGFYVLVPGTSWSITAAPEVINGVTGVAHYRVNRRGIRGRDFGPDHSEYRILAIGGSTTECAQLDETEVWTSLMEAALARSSGERRPWVGNIGRSGLTSREHVVQLKYLLDQYPHFDALVALVGVNDMLGALRRGWDYRLPTPITQPAAEQEDLARAFAVVPPGEPRGESWVRRTALWHLARQVKLSWNARRTFDLTKGAQGLIHAREHRLQGRVIDTLPPLDAPLSDYRYNLTAMAALARAARTRLVLVTAPSLWRANLSPREAEKLWFGWIGSDWPSSASYFSSGALASAMARYNTTMLDVCRDQGIECVDAASVLPRDTLTFYDDIHFTEAGSRALASLLTSYFRSRAP